MAEGHRIYAKGRRSSQTKRESLAAFAVPSTSLRELDCLRCLSNHDRWLSEAEMAKTPPQIFDRVSFSSEFL